MNLVERIYAKCEPCGDCLIWQGASPRGNSPQIKVDGRPRPVRRVLYEATQGPVPKGKTVVVTCECPNCVFHIAPMTRRQLALRVAATGVNASVTRCARIAAYKRSRSQITDEMVHDIRNGPGTLLDAANRHGISEGYAGRIRRGQARKDYSNPFAGLMS